MLDFNSKFNWDMEFKRRNKYVYIYLFVLIINLLTGKLLTSSYDGNNQNLFLLCWNGNILMFFSVLTWIKTTKTFFSPYLIFLLSFYSFSYGQAFLRSLGAVYEGFNLYGIYSNDTLLMSHYYTLVGLSFMHLGALTAIIKRDESGVLNVSPEVILDKFIRKSILIVAWPIFIVSSIVYFQNVIEFMITAFNQGYMALYNYNSSSINETSGLFNLLSSIKMFFVPSVFLLIVAYSKNRVLRNVLITVVLSAVFFNFLAGVRTDAAALLISFVLLFHNFIKPFKGKHTFIGILAALVLLILLNIVGQTRGDEGRDLSHYLDKTKEVISEKNPIVDTIGEMGGSMFPLIEIMKIVPEQFKFKNGETYLSALLAVFPSSLVDGIIPRVSLPNWLMLTLNMNYGPGFSLLAEGYYNFGWGGSIFMFVIGFFIARLFNPRMSNETERILKSIFIPVMLYFFITASRGDSLLLVRYVVFYSFIPYMVIKTLIATFKKNGVSESRYKQS